VLDVTILQDTRAHDLGRTTISSEATAHRQGHKGVIMMALRCPVCRSAPAEVVTVGSFERESA